MACAFSRTDLTAAREAGVPLRVITTTYMGATEREALDRLVRDFGAEVKVQYDAASHAPSRQGLAVPPQHRLRHGLCRILQSLDARRCSMASSGTCACRRVATPSAAPEVPGDLRHLLERRDFEPYDPDRDRDRLDDALAEAAGTQASRPGDDLDLAASRSVRTLPAGDARRARGRARPSRPPPQPGGRGDGHRQDRRRRAGLPTLCAGERDAAVAALRRPPREILEQSLRTYREVLGDADFGELYVGGARPERWHHVFASVQSLTSYGVDKRPGRRLRRSSSSTSSITPRQEPIGGSSITFSPPSSWASPPRRSGPTVSTSARSSMAEPPPSCGCGTRSAPTCFARSTTSPSPTAPTCADRLVARALRRGRSWTTCSPATTRAPDRPAASCGTRSLTWARCAPSGSVSASRTPSTWPSVQRRRHPGRSRQRRNHVRPTASRHSPTCATGDVNALFAADLFNEGLDIPDVDTVLFLRPTESATVFLQQLGRGLRRTHDKAVLTVLDFVGHHRKEFRFDQQARALTGRHSAQGSSVRSRRAFRSCRRDAQIVDGPQAQSVVLENIRSQVANRWQQIVAELRSYGDQDLSTFSMSRASSSATSFGVAVTPGPDCAETQVCRPAPGSALEEKLLKRVRAFAHVDDPVRAADVQQAAVTRRPKYEDARHRRTAPGADALLLALARRRWLHHRTTPVSRPFATNVRRAHEIAAVVDLSFDAARHVSSGLTGHSPTSRSRSRALPARGDPRRP